MMQSNIIWLNMKILTRIIILPLFVFFLIVGNFPSLAYAQTPAGQNDCPEGTRFVPGNLADSAGLSTSASCVALEESGAYGSRTDTSVACTFGWSGGVDNINPVCWMRALLAVLGELFLTIGTWAVTFAGGAFDYLLIHGITEFGNTIRAIESSINTGWAALRDIANIVIIGLFVFIAINIILGVQEFGAKKKVAQVLIVAVLINFSLLFTKVIVDASNFTAYQFYNNAFSLTSQEGGVALASSDIRATENNTGASVTGIGGRFLALAGVETLWDGYDLIRNVQESQDSALTGMLYGMMMFVFLIATAFVLLYGAFLILSRAILIVFLMLTSALAFASWLIPQQYVVKGFSAWWESLLKAAFFAPILMALLWVVITVGEAIVGTSPRGGSLGQLAENAANEGNLQALFNFLLIIGLLFAALVTASAFSKTIAGFSSSASLAASPFTLGSRFVGGLLRGTAGAGAYFAGGRAVAAVRVARNKAAKAEIEAERLAGEGKHSRAAAERLRALGLRDTAASKLKSAGRWGAVAGSKFNVMNTRAAQTLVGAAGIKGFASGASSKAAQSFANQVETRAKAAEKIASKAAPSKEQNDEAKRQARINTEEARTARREQLAATRNAARSTADAVKENEQLMEKMTEALAQKDDAIGRKTAIRGNEGLSARERASQLRAEDRRIEQASTVTRDIQSRIEAIEKPHREAHAKVEEWDKGTEAAVKQAQTEIVEGMARSAADIAGQVGAKQGDILTRTLGAFNYQNKAVGDKTKEVYSKNLKTADLRAAVKSVQNEDTSGKSEESSSSSRSSKE